MLTAPRDLKLATAITGSYPRPLWYDANLDGRSFKRRWAIRWGAAIDRYNLNGYIRSCSTPIKH